MISLQIPSNGINSMQQIDLSKNLIIVGANWSWKTRFGSSIEQSNLGSKIISAQRALLFNENVPKQDYESAYAQLKASGKHWAVIQPQNDFNQTLICVNAEETKRNEIAIEGLKSSDKKNIDELPPSIKERVINIWNFIFPYRPLNLKGDKVRAVNNESEFSWTEMSDGEKVALYLISQVLLVEDNWILIIDEPELHLHKALMVRLWNRLEEERKDCTFIYITHDLDFAVSRTADQIIWIKSYLDSSWEWELFEPNGIIPENLYLEILGSRTPILLIEWDKSSLDYKIYQSVYPDFTMIPCGWCEKVIEWVKRLMTHSSLHNKKIYWIIDRDFRPQNQLDKFQKSWIYHTTVNKIENFFLVPEIIDLVWNHLEKVDKIHDFKSKIIKLYQKKGEEIKFQRNKFLINNEFNDSIRALNNLAEFDSWKNSILSGIDAIWLNEDLPITTDLVIILKNYPYKWLMNEVQSIFWLSGDLYEKLVLELFSWDKKDEILKIFREYLPVIPYNLP